VTYYKVVKNTPPELTILSKDEHAIVQKCVELIAANPYTTRYFSRPSVGTEVLHQVDIYYTYRGHSFKALLDGILVDHENKTIEPFDLKTTGKSVYEFVNSYVNYGYFRQCALYEYAIQQPESPVFDLIQAGYQIKDFTFIVVETKGYSTHPAIIYRTTKEGRTKG